MTTFYTILNIPPQASQEAIESAFFVFKLGLTKYNKGWTLNDESLQFQFPETYNAYRVLSDPLKRKEYDEWLRSIGQFEEVKIVPEALPEEPFEEENPNLIARVFDKLPAQAKPYVKTILILLLLCFLVMFVYLLSQTPFQLI